MDIYKFIVEIIENLAWPITVGIIIFFFKIPLKDTLSRIAKLKHGKTEVTFSEISKKIISEKPSNEEKKKLSSHQIIYKNKFSRLYSNGILVHRYKVVIKAIETTSYAVFPLAFPNEPFSVEFIGSVTARVVELNQGNFTFVYEPIDKDLEIELVISGL